MKKFIIIGNIITGLLVLFVSVSVFFIKMPVTRQTYSVRESADSGWYYADGTEAVLSDLQYTSNQASIFRTITAEQLQSANLCLSSESVNFSVYLNGTEIYNYHPVIHPMYGFSYGVDFHNVTIPYFTGEATLSLELEDLSNGKMWTGFNDAYFEDGAEYLFHTLTSNFFKVFIAFLTFVFGIIMMTLGLIFQTSRDQRLEMISLGALSMILSMWTITGSYFLGMLTGNPGYVRMINFMTLLMLPIIGVTLVACLTKNVKSKSVFFIMAMTFSNLIFHIIMLLGKRMDYHDMLPLSHLCFLCGVGVAIYLVIQSIRQKQLREKQPIVILIAFIILMTGGIADLIFYYLGTFDDVARFSRLGLLIFVALLASYEVEEFIVVTRENQEIEVMRRLAHEDGLTGLENRLSFNEYESELKQNTIGKCLVIQFDINNLKKVNDTYGHMAGDSFIKAAANIISTCFGKYGRVFRTGGDEFVSIFLMMEDTSSLTSLYAQCAEQMNYQIEQYNQKKDSPIPLTIAYGMAECDFKKDDIKSKEILADKRMYEHKRSMKGLSQ